MYVVMTLVGCISNFERKLGSRIDNDFGERSMFVNVFL